MKDKEQDVLAQAAAQMHKALPPIVQTVTQAKADFERLYHQGGDGKSTPVKMQTSTGEDVQVVLAENAGTGKGKSFLPGAGQSVEWAEQERLKLNREYFEDGCLCIHTSKTLQPFPSNMSDAEAVAFYEQNCKCSRNYVPN
ncbi:hypothetical protein [Pseudomonas rhodesiae]|uniref:hypothetical protein n=1 Tax=Pseudomonas rhodesiae TaxID=76760 RepID=UPI00209FDE72|nr:hypothetical protein [Pseudomonas rhodesiae]MCP1515644.1 hypothetical protein [Pseudomonas rhodesiae]MDF9772890.1 hypothetical protein [Pseudomonas rhodesiae]